MNHITSTPIKMTIFYPALAAYSIYILLFIPIFTQPLNAMPVKLSFVITYKLSHIKLVNDRPAEANGVQRNIFRVQVVDHKNKPAPNQPIKWRVDGDESVKIVEANEVTQAEGYSTVHLISDKTTSFVLVAILTDGTKETLQGSFLPYQPIQHTEEQQAAVTFVTAELNEACMLLNEKTVPKESYQTFIANEQIASEVVLSSETDAAQPGFVATKSIQLKQQTVLNTEKELLSERKIVSYITSKWLTLSANKDRKVTTWITCASISLQKPGKRKRYRASKWLKPKTKHQAQRSLQPAFQHTERTTLVIPYKPEITNSTSYTHRF